MVNEMQIWLKESITEFSNFYHYVFSKPTRGEGFKLFPLKVGSDTQNLGWEVSKI